jgi:hypothetical protein
MKFYIKKLIAFIENSVEKRENSFKEQFFYSIVIAIFELFVHSNDLSFIEIFSRQRHQQSRIHLKALLNLVKFSQNTTNLFIAYSLFD